MKRRPKVRTTITVDQDLFDWLQEQVGPGQRFHNLSHGFESGVQCLRREGELVQQKLELEARLSAFERSHPRA